MNREKQRRVNIAAKRVVESRLLKSHIIQGTDQALVGRLELYDLWKALYDVGAVDYGFTIGANGVSKKTVEASTKGNKEG